MITETPPTRSSNRSQIAELVGPPATRSYSTMLEALVEAARADAPLFVLRTGKEPEHVDARAALAGAFRVTQALRRAGVRRHDAVPILLPTSADLVHALLGTMLLGAVPAPLATPMTFGGLGRFVANLTAVVEDSDARVIISDSRIRDAIAGHARLSARLDTVLTPADLASAAPTRDPRLASVDAASPALLQYTSGTTGAPKGVVVSHGALTANAGAIAAAIGIGAHDVGVSWLPLYHDMGLVGVLCTAVCHPYPVHVIRPESFVMKPRRWLELIGGTRATISVAPNFAFDLTARRVTDELEQGLGSWRVALNGAEPVHESTLQRFRDRFASSGYRPEAMTPVYGMAEATLAVTFSDTASEPRTLSVDRGQLERGAAVTSCSAADAYVAVSVGKPVAGASVRIDDDEGHVLPERTVGEIKIGGASLMTGYRGQEQATGDAMRGGFLSSGDLGFIDGGELFVIGRAKDVVILGGRNVHPYDVERIAAEAIGMACAAAAFGRSNSLTGTDDLIVVVEARVRDETERNALRKSIRGAILATVGACAAEVHVWPLGSIPRTTSGKVRRHACAQALHARGPS